MILKKCSKLIIYNVQYLNGTTNRIFDQHIAGDPMDENIKWVKISKSDICAQMKREGITVSVNIVRKLLKKYNFVDRRL